MPDEERVKKGLLLPIIDIHWSDLSLVVGIYIIGPKKSIVFGLGHAGEVGRAVAAGVAGAWGKNPDSDRAARLRHWLPSSNVFVGQQHPRNLSADHKSQ